MKTNLKKTGKLISLMMVIVFWTGFFSLPVAAQKEIRLVNWERPDLWKKLTAAYEKENPDIKFKLEIWTFADYHPKLLIQFAGGIAPDIAQIGTLERPRLVPKGMFLPLDEYIEKYDFPVEDFNVGGEFNFINVSKYRGPKEEYKGKLFGLMWNNHGAGMPMVYNQTMFDEAGLEYPGLDDWTWKEYLNAAKKLTKRDSTGEVVQWGTVAIDSGDIFAWNQFLWGNGGEIFNKTGRYRNIGPEGPTECTLNSPEAIETFQFLLDLQLKYKVAAPPRMAASLRGGRGVPIESGKVAISFSWIQPLLLMSEEKYPFEWFIAMIPANKPESRAANLPDNTFNIFKGSKYPEESFEFLMWFLTDEEAIRIMSPLTPPCYAPMIEKTLNEMPPPKQKMWRLYLASMKYGRPWPPGDMYTELNNVTRAEIEKLFVEKQSVREAVDKMVKGVNRLLEEKGER